MLVTFTFPALNATHIMSSRFALNMGFHLKPGQSTQKALLWRDLLGLTLQSARLHWSLGTPEGGKCTSWTVFGCTNRRGYDPGPGKLDPLSQALPSGHQLWIMTSLSSAFSTTASERSLCIIHTTRVFWGLQQRVCDAMENRFRHTGSRQVGTVLMSGRIPLPNMQNASSTLHN